ncbi:MAG TPA: ABC transporter substrate-binding protein [Blastocatellia bacterium]|nr:ABC transporter substrate-binding protein [Blastocatellia bacterium]
MKTRQRLWPVLILVATALAACSPGGGGGTGGASKPLHIVAAEPTTGLDPGSAATQASRRAMELMYDQLIDYNSKDEIVPAVAKSWEVSGDGLTYTFHLQPNAKFSDGSAITATDVQFSVQRMATSAVLKPAFTEMRSVDVVDPQTVKITLSKSSRPFLNALATAGIAAILSQKAVQGNANYFRKPTATSGAWSLKEWIPKDHLTLVANTHYWNTGYPKIPTINYTFQEDPTSAAAALESGTADMYYPMAPTDAIRLKDAGKITFFAPNEPGVLVWGFDRTKPPFNDVKVRQALAYMAPREDRWKNCWLSTGGLSYGAIILEGSWAYTPGIEKYKVSKDEALSKADALMKAAGWIMGSAGVRVSKGVPGMRDGTLFKVTVPFENNWDQSRCHTTLLKNDLQPLGVDVTPQAYDAATYYSDVGKNKFQMFHAGNGYANVDDMMQQTFTTTGIVNALLCKVTDTKLDTLVTQARATQDRNQAKTYYAQMQTLIQEDVPCINSGSQASITATGLNVHGYAGRTDNSNRSLIFATVS